MNLSDFDYELPTSFIAQTPVEPRDSSRLLVLERASGEIRHARFHEIGGFLQPGDLLVFNDTRVLPARLFAAKRGTGGKVELLLLRRREPQIWEALAGGKRIRPGTVLELTPKAGIPSELDTGSITVEVLEDLGESRRLVRFSQPLTPRMESFGYVPLPPYIHAPLRDPERYQTVYARDPGSAAAPTAGLHFTPALIEQLRGKGVRTATVTLHVGLDTFAPITEERVEDHAIHSEWIQVPEAAAREVAAAKEEGRRVVAVGTTTVRALESAAAFGAPSGTRFAQWEGETRLFITPGFSFRVVDAMITNFHLPRSTLLVLVSAFAARETILGAYEEAKRSGYRFYSFGDAMLML
jgi:S-adenosylmethionine:tRNA ribosyltransferase-isomerase